MIMEKMIITIILIDIEITINIHDYSLIVVVVAKNSAVEISFSTSARHLSYKAGSATLLKCLRIATRAACPSSSPVF